MRHLFLCFTLALLAPVHAEAIRVAPGASVQAALDRARPGDTVLLAPGVHRGRVSFKNSGAFSRPITLQGEPGAILDGSEDAALDWKPAPDVAPGAFRAKASFPVFTLTAGGKIVTMLREDRVRPGKNPKPDSRGVVWEWPSLFQNGVGPSKWAGVKALALYLPGPQEVLVRFEGDLDPRKMAITLAPREPVVKISGANRCVVRNLSIRNAACGVWIEDSIGSVVEGCRIGPVDYGVWLDRGADRATIRFNELFMNPYSGADPRAPGAWDNWQAHKQGGHYDRYGVQIHRTRGGHEVHDNWVHDTWDGIEDRGGAGENVGLRIHHNLIQNVSDDGLEPNGAEQDCRWSHNIVERSICALRVKAPTQGPLFLYRNIFLDSTEDIRFYGEVELKPAVVFAYHNTSTSGAAITSNKVFGIGTPNYHVFNNLFWCERPWRNDGGSVAPNWKAGHNVFVRRGDDPRWDESRAVLAGQKLDETSLFTTAEPGFANAEKRDLSLLASSPARGRGGDLAKLLGQALPGLEGKYFPGAAPDAGALQFGESMPRLPRAAKDVNVPPAGSWPDAGAEEQAARELAAPILFANGGFEMGFEGWGKADAAFTLKDGEAAEGAKFASVLSQGKRVEVARKISGLVPGRPYALTFWSRGSTFPDARVIVRDLGSSKYLGQAAPASGAKWEKKVVRFVAPAAEVGLEISLRSTGACDLDGFTVERGQ